MADIKKFAAILCATTALVAVSPALAQDADAAPAEENTGGIEEIVVTAQKRAESAQDVPIAISVFREIPSRSAR
jgi:iron complex outermembrane recepter protein